VADDEHGERQTTVTEMPLEARSRRMSPPNDAARQQAARPERHLDREPVVRCQQSGD
jgi:hypothetical protein